MTQIEELFLAAYPLWPRALLEKFSSLLSLEVAKFNPEIDKDLYKTYISIPDAIRVKVLDAFNNDNALLTPRNQQKLVSIYYGRFEKRPLYRRRPFVKYDLYNGPVGFINYFGKLSYDKRIFETVAVSDVELIYYVSRTEGTLGLTSPYDYYEYLAYDAYLILNVSMQKYDGAASVLAMAENGLPVKYNIVLLSEFVTYVKAYQKYSGQLAAGNSLMIEKSRQSVSEFKNTAAEKITARKNELQDLKTQITFAAKNETNSAKRDMQQLALSAQSLMIQLQDRVKKI